MKKFIYILVASFLLSFTGCSAEASEINLKVNNSDDLKSVNVNFNHAEKGVQADGYFVVDEGEVFTIESKLEEGSEIELIIKSPDSIRQLAKEKITRGHLGTISLNPGEYEIIFNVIQMSTGKLNCKVIEAEIENEFN